MAVTSLVLFAERWLDEVVLSATVADVAIAPIVESFISPAGIGDLAIMSVHWTITSVQTVPVSATVARGIRATVLSPDGATTVDLVGVSEWYAVRGSGAAFDGFDAYMDPDALVLFRQGEQLTCASPEMDAGITGDLRVFVKAVRVRPTVVQGAPLQLVR